MPATTFGVLPYDWESRQPWVELPFPPVAPGLGQATIEDSLLVREEGCEVLSTAERRLW